jgi:2-polyprenyl-6-hydroxyphenyl methylase/3-demethylubiquinone-9 3-methyltransferase
MNDSEQIRRIMPEIVRAYDSPLVRGYCRARFLILRERFTREIAQYVPAEGRLLELGCGFGLFTILFARLRPGVRIEAFDLNSRRIEMARKAAHRLGVANVEFHCADAATTDLNGPYSGGFLMDLVHHVGRENAEAMLRRIHGAMAPGSTFIIKEVDSRPIHKRWFTRALDFMMSPRDPVYYWPEEEMTALLRSLGWRVGSHAMVDILPYPHRLYVCRN